MCREMDQIYKEGAKIGKAEGIEIGEMKAKCETALTLAERGMTATDIADIVKVSLKIVQEWLFGNVSLAK